MLLTSRFLHLIFLTLLTLLLLLLFLLLHPLLLLWLLYLFLHLHLFLLFLLMFLSLIGARNSFIRLHLLISQPLLLLSTYQLIELLAVSGLWLSLLLLLLPLLLIPLLLFLLLFLLHQSHHLLPLGMLREVALGSLSPSSPGKGISR